MSLNHINHGCKTSGKDGHIRTLIGHPHKCDDAYLESLLRIISLRCSFGRRRYVSESGSLLASSTTSLLDQAWHRWRGRRRGFQSSTVLPDGGAMVKEIINGAVKK